MRKSVHNIILARNNIKILLIYSIVVFFCFSFGYMGFGLRENIPTYLLFLEHLFAVLYASLLYFYSLSHPKIGYGSFFVVFFLTLLCSVLIRFLFIEYTGNVFQGATDSYFYDEESSKSVLLGYDYIQHLRSVDRDIISGLNIDDYGFLSVEFFVYRLFGVDAGRWVMLILNSLCVAISSQLMWLLLVKMNYQRVVVSFCYSVFAFFTFFAVTAAVGLKENIFVLLVSISLYAIYRHKCNGGWVMMTIAVTAIASTFFFRTAIGVMLIIVFILSEVITKKNHRSVIITSLFLGLIILSFFTLIFRNIFGIGFDHIINVSHYRMGGEAFLNWAVQLLSAMIGPFPNYSRAVQYGIISTYSLQLKCFLSFVVLMSIWNIIKNAEYKLYWILCYYLLGIIMLTISAVSLDMRFHVTFFPAFVLLLANALDNVNLKSISFNIYIIVLTILVSYYNIR